jgi:hypothetical protein
MRLEQLYPIENCIINGYSLIENVFGAQIVVFDVMGGMYTTARNVKLLERAQTVIENLHGYDLQSLTSALNELRDEAEILTQAEYDRAVRMAQRAALSAEDVSELAGCLE